MDEIVTIDNTREVQQAIAFNLNTYAISAFHLEIPNSENHKNDGIYVCKKGVCFAPVQSIEEFKKLL